MTLAINSTAYDTSYLPSAAATRRAEDTSLSSDAATLSGESAVVASLGGGSTGTGLYTPTGLLSAIDQAGDPDAVAAVPDVGSATPDQAAASAQQALDQGVVGTLATSASGSGVYGGTGVLQGLPSAQLTANWTDILQSNPSLAGQAVAASYNQGLVSSLQVTA